MAARLAIEGGTGSHRILRLPWGDSDALRGASTSFRSRKLLTGDTKSKVQAAATAKVKGTVERVETNVDSSAPYEAHIRKADGTEVEVTVNQNFTVAAVNEMGPGGPRHP